MVFQREILATSILRIALAALLTLALALPASAITLLRDADIEHGLKQIAAPILRAAGLNPNRVKVLVVNEPTLNAFVVSSDAIFVHYGLINKLTSAAQLQGVIAHEAAHITNGHLARRMQNLQAARTAAGLGVALAAAAAAAGGGKAAGALAIGASSSAQRMFLAHTRAEEASADQSAVRYMRAAGASPVGLQEVMEIFRGQEVLSAARQDPYLRSHPLSRDRLRAIKGYAAAHAGIPSDPNAEYWFARIKGKLTAHTRNPKWTLRRVGDSGYGDVKAIRQAVAFHRQSKTKKALAAIDRAIAARPKDPFLRDLKGEILMQSRNFAAAVQVYNSARKLAPREPLILSGYGRALLATGQAKAALGPLQQARSIDYRDGHMLRDLGQAYAKTGQRGMASLVTAERYALQGRLKDAGIHAKRASDLLPTGSGPWQRAQDVLIASERHAKRKR